MFSTFIPRYYNMIYYRYTLADSFPHSLLLLAWLAGVFLLFPGQPWAANSPEDVVETSRTPGSEVADAPDDSAPHFTFSDVETLAKALAVAPYDSHANMAPDYLGNLTQEQWRSFKFKQERVLWREEGLPYSIGFLHPGYIFTRFAEINVVDADGVTKIPFSADMFEFNDEALAEQVRNAPTGFAGFQLLVSDESSEDAYGRNSNNRLAGFMGASNFMFKGRNSRMGSYSRAIALDTALPSGEIYPYFKEFWLIKPAPDSTSLRIYALMDSAAMTGAYQIEITPGTSTVVKVDAKLFKRHDAKQSGKIGIAPLASMFLFSETFGARSGDYRPEVHNADGLLFLDGGNNWCWRPLSNDERLNISDFTMINPRGFGLMQRDFDFDHYQDIAARFDRRASVWVEPVGDWGTGRLELVEIPGTREFHNNILAFWVPENKGQVNGNGEPQEPSTSALVNGNSDCAFSYIMYWMPPGASPHSLGRAVDTRIVRVPDSEEVTFIVDFDGGELDALNPDVGLTSVVESSEQAPLVEKMLDRNPATSGWRLVMKFRLPQNGVLQRLLNARDGPTRLRFKAHLKKGENIPEPLTETWIYDLAP